MVSQYADVTFAMPAITQTPDRWFITEKGNAKAEAFAAERDEKQ